MAVTEDSLKIARFRQAVLRRRQLLALMDALSLVILAGGLVAAAVVLYARLKPVNAPLWAIASGIFSVLTVGFFIRWYVTRATTRDAAFLIDNTLGLEDRIATAHAIEEKGGSDRAVEMALVQDAAERLSGARPSAVVPYVFPKVYALRFVGVVALVTALLIPERSLPGGQALVEAREDIQTAGEQLEQTSTLIQQNLPPETETAQLAKEQAELGSSLRRSNTTRAEALQKLSALEDRIRQRHDQLEDTRADEIVALAERRLRSALSALPKQQSNKAASKAEESAISESKDSKTTALKDEKKATATNEQTAKDAPDKAEADESEKSTETEPKSTNPQKTGEAEPGKEVAKGGDKSQKPEAHDSAQANPQQDKATDAGVGAQQTPSANDSPANAQQNAGEKPKPENKEDKGEQQNPLSGLMADQAAKALPALSEQLLKQAEQLRVGEIKPEDIQRLQQAAQVLMRDLERIAQSKEFQQALEQMARQINPEQIERVARQLMSQEKLRAELESAARLWAENRQAKEMVSGLARKLDKLPVPSQQRGNEDQRAGNNPGGSSEISQQRPDGKGYGKGTSPRGRGEGKDLTGKGREVKVGGNPQRGSEGEYLFLQTRPGAGAARAPYTSAYPQYRREAERSVERSQVPSHLRSVVRNYFDAINPDARKQN